MTILIAEISVKAHVNLGIVSSVFSIQIVIQSLMSYFVFNEKLTTKTILGMTLALCGIIWISIAKGSSSSSVDFVDTTHPKTLDYESQGFIIVFLAVIVALVNTLKGL